MIKKDVTVVVVYNDKTIYEDFLDSLETQTVECRLIGIDNTKNKYASCSKALNIAVKQVKTKYVIFSHQDILFPAYDTLENFVSYMESAGDFALLGVAGKFSGSGYTNVVSGNTFERFGLKLPEGLMRINNMDECFFGGPTNWITENPFDEVVCNNWHLYSNERAMYATTKGDNCYLCGVEIIHRSGGTPNKAFYEGIKSLAKKYKNDFPIIETMVYTGSIEKAISGDEIKKITKQKELAANGWIKVANDYCEYYSKSWRKKNFLKYKRLRQSNKNITARDFFAYEFFNKKADEINSYFVGNEYSKLVKEKNKGRVNATKRAIKYRELFNLNFGEKNELKWFAVRSDTTFEDLKDWIKGIISASRGSNVELVIKPSNIMLGNNIYEVVINDDNDIKDLFERIKNKRVILEEKFYQHLELSNINTNTLNTINLFSVRTENRIEVVTANIKMGVGDCGYYDPQCYIMAPVDTQNGVIKESGKKIFGFGEYNCHPCSGIKLVGYQIPDWSNLVNAARDVHEDIEAIRYLNLEFTISNEGKPILLRVGIDTDIITQQRLENGGLKPKYNNAFEERRTKNELQEEKKHIIAENRKYAKRRTIKNDPTVSVIIVNRNGRKYLERLFNSIRECDFYPVLEYIIIDNASSDGSVSYLKEISNEFNIKIICNRENKNFSEANNQGVNEASGEYVVCLNNDIEVTDFWLDELLYVASTNENVGIVGSRLLFPEWGASADKALTIQHKGIGFRYLKGDYLPYEIRYDEPFDYSDNESRKMAAVTAACILIKKDVFVKMGMFDEKYEYGFEDMDLSLRAHALGYNNYICPSSMLFHYTSATRKLDDAQKKRNELNFKLLRDSWSEYVKYAMIVDKIDGTQLFTSNKLEVAISSVSNETREMFRETNVNVVSLNNEYRGRYHITKHQDVVVVTEPWYDASRIYPDKPGIVCALIEEWNEEWKDNICAFDYDFVVTRNKETAEVIAKTYEGHISVVCVNNTITTIRAFAEKKKRFFLEMNQ